MEKTGQIVFGDFWQRPMAAYLRITTKTIQRWLYGTHLPEEERMTMLERRLRVLTEQKLKQVTALREELGK